MIVPSRKSTLMLCLLSLGYSVAFQCQCQHPCQRKKKQIRQPHDDHRRGPVPLRSMLLSDSGIDAVAMLDDFFKTQPFLSAFLACSVKASAADLLAQTSLTVNDAETTTATNSHTARTTMASVKTSAVGLPAQRHNLEQTVQDAASQIFNQIDLQRNLAFLLYGGLYQGMFLQFLYVIVYPNLYGGSNFFVPLSIFSDILAFGPFVTLPMAYMIRGLVEFDSSEEDSSKSTGSQSATTDGVISPMHQAFEKYKDHILTQNLLGKYWMIWAPAQTINWCFVPDHLRILFVAGVSFFWVYLLSAISSLQTTTETAASFHTANKNMAKLQPGRT